MSLPATPLVTHKDSVPTPAAFPIGSDFLLGRVRMLWSILSDLSCHSADIGGIRGAIVGSGEASGLGERRSGRGESRLCSSLSVLLLPWVQGSQS